MCAPKKVRLCAYKYTAVDTGRVQFSDSTTSLTKTKYNKTAVNFQVDGDNVGLDVDGRLAPIS